MALLEALIEHKWPLLASVVTLYALHSILSYRRLRQFGGPWGVGFSEIPHDIQTYRGNGHDWYRKANDKYGPIARVGPNSLITSSADVWIHVNTKPGYKRSERYFKAARLEYQRDNVFSQTNTKLHDERRKQLAPGYSGRDNPVLEQTINTQILALLTLIRTHHHHLPPPTHDHHTRLRTFPPLSRPLDLSKTIQYLTLDIISALLFTRPFGLLRANADAGGNTFMALHLSWLAQAPIIGKDVPEKGDVVVVEGREVFMPGGATIGYSAVAMHRDKKVYGEDADLFRPERWFEPDEGKLAAMLKVNELTFGHGRWQCLGKNVAQMELNKTVFELFRHFDWAIAYPAKPWDIFNAFGLFLISDMWVQVTARGV
ncbi:hypothetical protein N0V88_006343 [Collariella sp. IMI 366227]|nr:hypothetical protein N0V88_006343 [Collariella sp. IMI 366227]